MAAWTEALDRRKPICFTDTMSNTQRHTTRTYRGRPACAGSMSQPINGYECRVCGRSDMSLTQGTRKITTHIHIDDLATKPRHTASNPAPKVVKPKTPVADVPEFTQEQQDAIRAFCADKGNETWDAMKDAVGRTNTSWVIWARKEGIN